MFEKAIMQKYLKNDINKFHKRLCYDIAIIIVEEKINRFNIFGNKISREFDNIIYGTTTFKVCKVINISMN